jgi:hypothetical protein
VPADDTAIGDIGNEEQLLQAIAQLESQMREAAKNFEFERAATLRDKIRSLKQRDLGVILTTELPAGNQPPQPPTPAANPEKIAASAPASKPRHRR